MDARAWPPGYTEWPAPAALRGAVACLWAQVTTGADRPGLVLRRRCHAAVGYGPKTLQRVLRFRRFVSRIDALPQSPGVLDLAAFAAEAGYADQAHPTRECGKLSGLTPAALARQRSLERR